MSLRRTLQRETSEIHALLDARASEQGWFEDLARYRCWLRGMHVFHREIACELDGFDVKGFHDEGRVERLRLDMQDLGVAPLAVVLRRRLGVTDRDTALGLLYVTEGATLGARVLVKRAMALGCSAEHGARFLGAEARGFATWHAVLAALDSAVLDSVATSRVAAVAVRSFELAVECLDGVQAE